MLEFELMVEGRELSVPLPVLNSRPSCRCREEWPHAQLPNVAKPSFPSLVNPRYVKLEVDDRCIFVWNIPASEKIPTKGSHLAITRNIMATDKNKIAADCFRKGTEALSKESWDYAVDMFKQSATFVPDNLLYRQSLRGAEYRKYNKNGTGARMAKMKLVTVRAGIKKAKLKKAWPDVDRAAEEGLMINPWDAQLNADMAVACANQGYQEVAVFGYEMARQSEPENQKTLRALAELLEERGEYTKALDCWGKITQLNPLDGEARSKFTQLGASQMLDRGGYEDAESTEDVRSEFDRDMDARKQKKSATPADGPGVSQEADLQHAIRKAPEEQGNYLKLAQFYQREGKLKQAAETYQKVLEVSGGDISIREQLEDVERQLMRQNLDLAKENLAQNPEDAKIKKQVGEMSREFVLREIEIMDSRVKRHPNEMKLKFDLARRYMQMKQWSKAIPHLQQAAKDIRLEGEVLVALGMCFINDKKVKLGRAQLEKAITKIDADEKPEVFIEVHYQLGRLCEQAGEKEAAEKHYYEVLAIDYEYKDTRQRLEELQEGGDE